MEGDTKMNKAVRTVWAVLSVTLLIEVAWLAG